MLKVQEFLEKNSLEALKEKYKIEYKINEELGVVCLNYNQIESPMNEEVAQECRALILELGTWKVRSWPFKKFFNLGEVHCPKGFNWNQFKTYEKLDGSLIHLWWHEKGWQIATRKVVDGSNWVGWETNGTYRGLTENTIVKELMITEQAKDEILKIFYSKLDKNICYSFELTSDLITSCVVNCNGSNITLIGARNLITLEEIDIESIDIDLIPKVKKYNGFNLELINKEIETMKGNEHEGFVIVDDKWNRIKIKCNDYLIRARLTGNVVNSIDTQVEVVIFNKDDDLQLNQYYL